MRCAGRHRSGSGWRSAPVRASARRFRPPGSDASPPDPTAWCATSGVPAPRGVPPRAAAGSSPARPARRRCRPAAG
ncbi:MAG: hypothetical protein E6R11_04420 [Rhodocyclaceae bacterium]|nr:MAG: hypothetical protein E6R11_04420 [Rhodocyclaceae bacterium]